MGKTITKAGFFGATAGMLCLMILFCPLIASSQQAEKNTIRTINKRGLEIARFEAYVQHEMDSLKVPGLSIAVINDGDIVYSAELGVKNLAPGNRSTGIRSLRPPRCPSPYLPISLYCLPVAGYSTSTPPF